MFGGGEMAHEHADAAGIDREDFLEVENDLVVTFTKHGGHDGIETVEGRTHAQATLHLDDFDPVLRACVDIQMATSVERKGGAAWRSRTADLALTPNIPFVRVRGQVSESAPKKQGTPVLGCPTCL